MISLILLKTRLILQPYTYTINSNVIKVGITSCVVVTLQSLLVKYIHTKTTKMNNYYNFIFLLRVLKFVKVHHL